MMTRILVLALVIGANGYAAIQREDILEAAAHRPLGQQVQEPNGSWRTPAYGDSRLEAAARRLALYARPWTVPKVLAWYEQEADAQTRADLLRVLAASRDPRAGLAIGAALKDAALEVRVEATEGLMDYFLGYAVGGGTEFQMQEVERWWKKNLGRLKQEAERLVGTAQPN